MKNENSSDPFRSNSPSVLVADDAPDVREAVRTWLEQLGHKVTTAANGNEAGRLLAHCHYDVVITDIIMPNGDGLEVIVEAKKNDSTVRIVAMSDGGRYLPPADCLRVAKGLGAHVTLLKPFTREQLLQAVDQAIVSGAVKSNAWPEIKTPASQPAPVRMS
jgi:CheY-like chemotaxis protein